MNNINKAVRSGKFLNIELDGSNVAEIYEANRNRYLFYKGEHFTEQDFINDELFLISDFESPLTSELSKKHKIYVDYLNERLSKHNNPEQANKTLFQFVNIFDSVPEQRVYSYFKAELVDKKYLDEATLQSYLLSAFEFRQPNEKINFAVNPDRGIMVDIFYRYFKNVALQPYGKKRKYCELLGEYFNGFETQKTFNNFRDKL